MIPTILSKKRLIGSRLATVDLGVRLGLPSLVAFALSDNRGSRRIMEKLGFHYERDIVYLGVPHVLYRRDRQPNSK